MAREKPAEVTVKPGDTDSMQPVTITQAELDEWCRRVFGGRATERITDE